MSSSAGSERCKKDERNQRTFKLTGVVSDGITLCKGVKRRKSCLGECRKKKGTLAESKRQRNTQLRRLQETKTTKMKVTGKRKKTERTEGRKKGKKEEAGQRMNGKEKKAGQNYGGRGKEEEKKERALKECGKSARAARYMYVRGVYVYVCMCLLVWSDKHQR